MQIQGSCLVVLGRFYGRVLVGLLLHEFTSSFGSPSPGKTVLQGLPLIGLIPRDPKESRGRLWELISWNTTALEAQNKERSGTSQNHPTARPPKCTSIKGLMVSISWYMGSLKGLGGAGVAD